MSTVAFDTHNFVKRLTAAGMPEPQAEVLAEEQTNLLQNNLATKADIARLEGLIRESELRMTIRLGSMLVVAVGVFAAIVKLL